MRFSGRVLLVSVLLVSPLVGIALAASPNDRASDGTSPASPERGPHQTEAALGELEKDPTTKDTTAEAVKKSREALERATRMHAAGDDSHARLAEGIAHDWAEVGKELARACQVEKKAAETHLAAQDASAQTDRERAMLEQRVAENGRLLSEIGLFDAGPSKAAVPDAGKTPAQTARKDGGK